MSSQNFPHRYSASGLLALLGSMLLVLSLSGASAEDAKTEPAKPDKDGFYALFDGKSLDGWKVGDKASAWKVEDGQMVVHDGPAHIFYVGDVHDHDWKNFHLKAEVMTKPHANSGIYFHTKYQENGWPNDGFEAQVNCTHTDWKKTGSLYDIVDIRDPHQKDNEWFTYEVIVKGDHVTLKIDGNTVNEWTQPAGLQAAGRPPRAIPSPRHVRASGPRPWERDALSKHPGEATGRLSGAAYLPASFTLSPAFFIALPVDFAASSALPAALPAALLVLSAALSMPSLTLSFMSPICVSL